MNPHWIRHCVCCQLINLANSDFVCKDLLKKLKKKNISERKRILIKFISFALFIKLIPLFLLFIIFLNQADGA